MSIIKKIKEPIRDEEVSAYPLNLVFVRKLLFLVSLLILFSACEQELTEIDDNKVLKKLSEQEKELIRSNNNLSLDIIQSELESNNNSNFLFSPLSVGMSLGMIYNGVGDNEKLQIQHIMGLESLAEKEINKSYNELISYLQLADNQFNISFANSLWFSTDININEDFRTRVMAYYDAEIEELNFRKASSIEFINHWGNLKSNGRFTQLIKRAPNPNDDIMLVNALALNADWKRNQPIFEAESEFLGENGSRRPIRMIHWEGLNIKEEENGEYQFFEIPMEKDNYFLSVVVPVQDSPLNSFIDDFSMDELNYLVDNAAEYTANVRIPNIHFSSDKSLKSTLSNIGLNSLFLSTTDLSPAFVEKNRKISDINYLARIDLAEIVNRKETDAPFSDQNLKIVSANRPFLYFIRDKHTKTIIFAGYYINPE